MSDQQMSGGDFPLCVEHGIWTPLPTPPPSGRLGTFTLRLKDVRPREAERVRVAGAMTAQVRDPSAGGRGDATIQRTSFLYLLGDVVYKDDDKLDEDPNDQREMYNTQFYQPYSNYKRAIFAIAGNHDGKRSTIPRMSAAEHFQQNFCAPRGGLSPDNQTDQRPAMRQPYHYWRLSTPKAIIIGLYSNIANGGILDDPATPDAQPQYRWLVEQLADIKRRNARRKQRRAILLAVHYPPFSGASNFAQRGEPTLGPSNAVHARPLAAVLRQAFDESGQRPDAVFSAHAHLYQRLTYVHADGWEMPYVIAGSGGHGPVETLWEKCDKSQAPRRKPPFNAVLPQGLTLPAGERARVVAYNDASFGFLRVTVNTATLLVEFFTTDGKVIAQADSFRLDLATHHLAQTP